MSPTDADKLPALLAAADAAVPPPALRPPRELAHRVRRTSIPSAHRLLPRSVAAAAALLLALMLPPPSPTTRVPSPRQHPATNIPLSQAIDRQERLVTLLLQPSTRTTVDPQHRAVPSVDPLARLRGEADAAARVLFLAADQLEQETGLVAASHQRYAELIRAFPGTRWAALARTRLN